MSLRQYAKPDCEECGGDGIVEYGGIRSESDGCRTLPCEKCFPNGIDTEPDYDDYKSDRD